MWIALAVLGWLLLALVVVILAVLLAPIHLRARADSATAEYLFELRLFSARLPRLVRIRGTFGATGRTAPEPAYPERPAGKPRKKRRRIRLDPRRALHEIPLLLTDTLKGIHIDLLRLDARIGLADPAETGQLYGMLCPLAFGLPSGRAEIEVIPDFSQPGFSGEGEISIHFTPARLAWPTLRTGFRLLVRPG